MDETNDLPSDETEETETLTPSPFPGTTKERLDRYNHCALCGANLHVTHITDFARNLTQETARCPECGVRARKRVHSLQ